MILPSSSFHNCFSGFHDLVKGFITNLPLQIEFCLFRGDEGRGDLQVYLLISGRFKANNASGVETLHFQPIGSNFALVDPLYLLKFLVYMDHKVVFEVLRYSAGVI